MQEYAQQYHAVLQHAIPEEQVWGFGMLSTVGSMRGGMVGVFASPLVGWLIRRQGRKKAVGFPPNVLVAVTPTRIISFAYRPARTSVRLKGKVAEWHRQTVHVQFVAPSSSRGYPHVLFSFANGTSVELEVPTSFGQYASMNDSFYTALGFSPPSA
jgi:hypothetical protein